MEEDNNVELSSEPVSEPALETLDKKKGKRKNKKQKKMEIKQDENNQAVVYPVAMEKSSNKKLIPIIISTIVSIVLIVVICLLVFGGKPNEEKLDKEFVITNIKAKSSGNYISNNETFILETSAATEEIVRNHLYIEPPVNYEIKKINSKEYEVSVSDIPSDTIVNLSLVKNEVKSYSWAFQSTKDLKVVAVYPTDGSASVSTDTGITVTFSYPNVKDFEKHFEISPKVEGQFLQQGRVWKFIPSEPLKDQTTYTITISSGLQVGDNVLTESFMSSFSTYNRPAGNIEQDKYGKKANHSYISVDHINTFTPSEKITFKMYYNPSTINKIKMFKFNSYNDFMKFLNNETGYNAKDLGNQTFTKDDSKFTYTLDKTFEEGYYVEEVYLSTGELYATIPVQVNKLSAFLVATNYDILTWVGTGNELLKDIDVTYDGKSYKTDANGLALIKNYIDDKATNTKYVAIGDKTNPLVIGVDATGYVDYPSGYVYTDRPIYKNSDTVRIWGYVPLKFFEDMNIGFKKEDLVISVNNEKVDATITDYGTFSLKYELDNLADTYLPIEIKYKNSVIGARYVEVRNYTKQNYEYSVVYDKNYVKAGDNFNFKILVKHVTGINVQNKKITIEYEDKKYYGVTDENGLASFSIPTSKYAYDNNSESLKYENTYRDAYISVRTGESDYNENDFYFNFFVFNFLLDLNDYKYDPKNTTISLDMSNINLNGNVSYIEWGNIKDSLFDGAYNGDVELYLYEEYRIRKLSRVEYNPYTEKNENIYDYVPQYEKIVDSDKVTINNGKLNYKIKYNLKRSTDDDLYSYSLLLVFKDKNGNKFHYIGYIYENSFYDQYKSVGYYSEYYSGFYSDDYNYYRYYFNPSDKTKYSVNDQISLIMNSMDNSSIGEGKVLRVSLKDSIIESKLFDTKDNMDTIFAKSDIPGLTYTGALFKDGKFYRIPAVYYDYNEEDSRLSVEVKFDKDSYKPGEEVVAKLKVKNKDGEGVKAAVNLSVVDKAVFNISPEYTNFLENIYYNRWLKVYSFSSYRDFSLGMAEGGRGDTGDEIRKNFGDTVLFKEVETDANGEAEIKFKLNDSVTSFVVTTHAATMDVSLGENKSEIVSSLPLAISVIEPKGLKTTDDVVISANSVGDVKTDVKYTFQIKELDKKIDKTSKIGGTVYANFGKLPEGTYTVTINATSGNEKDAIEFPFVVKTTQQEISVKATSSIDKLKSIKPLKNPIVLEFYKNDFRNYMRYLEIMIETNQDRLDTRVAYYKALELENKYYGTDYPIHINDMSKFNNNGRLKYLENEVNSAEVTALVNYFYPSIYNLKPDEYYQTLNTTTDVNIALDQLLILASMKEPVLDLLKYTETIGGIDQYKLALAYLFIGDYNSAKKIYDSNPSIEEDRKGLRALCATFIDKEIAESLIDQLYEANPADRYVYFAMMSYFMNNERELSQESTITVTYGDKKETIKLKGLEMKKITISNKDLETLSISSDDERDMINYYYEGGISEISEENIKRNIKLTLSSNNLTAGSTVDLRIDLSQIKNTAGNIKLYLPNSMRFFGTVGGKGAYLSSNKGEYLVIYLSEQHSDVITVPVYLTYPGNYKIEELILKVKDNYYISNSVDVNIK